MNAKLLSCSYPQRIKSDDEAEFCYRQESIFLRSHKILRFCLSHNVVDFCLIPSIRRSVLIHGLGTCNAFTFCCPSGDLMLLQYIKLKFE